MMGLRLGQLTCLVVLTSAAASAQVVGRYIRIEAPASGRMALHEIEVWSGTTNLALKNGDLGLDNSGFRGEAIDAGKARSVVDGVADLQQRGLTVGVPAGVNPWLELDFGKPCSMDRLVVIQPQEPLYDDRALRLVSVLDEHRRVVFAAVFDIRRKPYDRGIAEWKLAAAEGRLIGRTVPVGAQGWASLGDLLEVSDVSEPPQASARAVRFDQRDTRAALERLATQFFARMDLAKPELQGVREAWQQQRYEAALNAYRDHFLAKLQRIAFLHEHPRPPAPYAAAADDLLRGIAVVFSRYDLRARAFRPGTIDWAAVAPDDPASVDVARVQAMAGQFQRPLLSAYRDTGRPEFLAQWSAITDDWGMNIRGDLQRAEIDLRDYFVKEPLQEFNHLADEIAQTARQQPEFGNLLSGATLARLLIPVLEEYPPAYWWPCRRATFNHTYNAMNAATVTARVLDDFYAGQRLDQENRQHWYRVWSMMMTRDGSMNEIGDEGHMDMQWRMGVVFRQMQKTPPPWFTPDFAAEFETGWRQTAVYPLRHLSPDGRGHRLSRRDVFDRIWQLTEPVCRIGGMIPRETVDSTSIMRHPEAAGIMQSVFGAGRERATLSAERQRMWDLVTAYYGPDFSPPTTVSDWMPYAGLHYLRQSWQPDATFVAMLCQPTGHPSTNGSAWNTEFHLFDHGQPLVGCSPVWIDGKPPFNEAGTLTYKPGSKTETLAIASERPIPARWHTSPRFDYAESWYEGTYQRHSADPVKAQRQLGASPVHDAKAERRIILVRPARLVIVTDAVRTPEPEQSRSYEIRQRFALTERDESDPKATTATVTGDADALTLANAGAPGVTVRRFTTARLAWDRRGTPESWEKGGSMMNHSGVHEQMGGILRAETRGNLLMVAMIESHRRPGEHRVQSVQDRTTADVAGFTATLHDGGSLTWLATCDEARPLRCGDIEVTGQGLLVWQKGDEVTGLMLGAQSLRLHGRQVTLPATDFEFSLAQGKLAEALPIHRPIEPVTFTPSTAVFVGSQSVQLHSATPGVDIRYTLDGSEPDLESPIYTAPLTITEDTFLRARAFRPSLTKMPWTAAGTEATVVSEARYRLATLRPAAPVTERLVPGLDWELVQGSWFALFSHLHLPEVMPCVAEGATTRLLDVSMRRGDGPFGVRYEGLLQIPADGVWTFHAPREYVGANCEPGYDLRVWVDGQPWDLGQRHHGRGQWSIALQQGLHRFAVTFADARNRDRTVPASGLWRGYPTPWVVWPGESPTIDLSGPDFPRQPLPDQWLYRQPAVDSSGVDRIGRDGTAGSSGQRRLIP